MRYVVTDQFTKISETAGTIQNVGNVYPVEISDKAEADSGILLYPLNKISFSDKTLYMRCVEAGGQAEIHVVPFTVDSDSGFTVADDATINTMLNTVFGTVGGGNS